MGTVRGAGQQRDGPLHGVPTPSPPLPSPSFSRRPPHAAQQAQQNLYARILARCYGLTVDRIYLVQLHPDLAKYRWVPVPMMPDLAEAMLLAREAQRVEM